MEIARITDDGQITVPITIQRKLKLKGGDKVVFYEDSESHVIMGNASLEVLPFAEAAFTDEARKVGIENEADIEKFVADFRRGRQVK